MGKAGAGCGEIPRGNSVCPKLLGLDWLVPGEKNKNLGGRKSLWRKEGACSPLRHWCIQCLMLCGKLLVLGDHNPGSSFLRWVSVTVRIMWLMSGPSMKKWMGISTRYL